jgi:hypothetical protein
MNQQNYLPYLLTSNELYEPTEYFQEGTKYLRTLSNIDINL